MVPLQPIGPKSSFGIGYWIAQAFQGRGIVTKSARKGVAYAFEVYGLWALRIAVAVENQRSRAIPERLGFVVERRNKKANKATASGTMRWYTSCKEIGCKKRGGKG